MLNEIHLLPGILQVDQRTCLLQFLLLVSFYKKEYDNGISIYVLTHDTEDWLSDLRYQLTFLASETIWSPLQPIKSCTYRHP